MQCEEDGFGSRGVALAAAVVTFAPSAEMVGTALAHQGQFEPGCNGNEKIKKPKCEAKERAVKHAIVVVRNATPGEEYTCTLDTGQELRSKANSRGNVIFKFTGDDAPPCGGNGATVCNQYKAFNCDCGCSPGPRGVQEFIEVGEHEWVAPDCVSRVMVELWGGSGGGAGGSGDSAFGGGGGGGGAGGYLRGVVNVTPGETYTVRIGLPGVRGRGHRGGNGEDGSDGSPTQFEERGGIVLGFAEGGKGGRGGAASGEGGAGGPGGEVEPVGGIARPGAAGRDGEDGGQGNGVGGTGGR